MHHVYSVTLTKQSTKHNLRISQWCCRGLTPSVMWHCVTGWMIPVDEDATVLENVDNHACNTVSHSRFLCVVDRAF